MRYNATATVTAEVHLEGLHVDAFEGLQDAVLEAVNKHLSMGRKADHSVNDVVKVELSDWDQQDD